MFGETQAYWISPQGHIIGVHGSHTDTVINSAGSFGVTKEWAEEHFKSGEEEAVINLFLDKGWIRIRFQVGRCMVSVKRLNTRTRRLLGKWAFEVLATHPGRAKWPVSVEETAIPGMRAEDTLDELKEWVLHAGKRVLLPIRDFYETWSVLPKDLLKESLDALERGEDGTERLRIYSGIQEAFGGTARETPKGDRKPAKRNPKPGSENGPIIDQNEAWRKALAVCKRQGKKKPGHIVFESVTNMLEDHGFDEDTAFALASRATQHAERSGWMTFMDTQDRHFAGLRGQ